VEDETECHVALVHTMTFNAGSNHYGTPQLPNAANNLLLTYFLHLQKENWGKSL
jgi:hypothetical protein